MKWYLYLMVGWDYAEKGFVPWDIFQKSCVLWYQWDAMERDRIVPFHAEL
jgi:hypothetical protein